MSLINAKIIYQLNASNYFIHNYSSNPIYISDNSCAINLKKNYKKYEFLLVAYLNSIIVSRWHEMNGNRQSGGVISIKTYHFKYFPCIDFDKINIEIKHNIETFIKSIMKKEMSPILDRIGFKNEMFDENTIDNDQYILDKMFLQDIFKFTHKEQIEMYKELGTIIISRLKKGKSNTPKKSNEKKNDEGIVNDILNNSREIKENFSKIYQKYIKNTIGRTIELKRTFSAKYEVDFSIGLEEVLKIYEGKIYTNIYIDIKNYEHFQYYNKMIAFHWKNIKIIPYATILRFIDEFNEYSKNLIQCIRKYVKNKDEYERISAHIFVEFFDFVV
jgi:hypothetical protein